MLQQFSEMPASLTLPIQWSGPFTPIKIIERFSGGGYPPDYNGDDYGLYQIYGKHILAGPDSLLYIGEATDQTFSARIAQHQEWLQKEYKGIYVHVGRLYLQQRHAWAKERWGSWEEDVQLAERILIYKYSPHYNSTHISEPPNLFDFGRVEIEHLGVRGRLRYKDIAPFDWE